MKKIIIVLVIATIGFISIFNFVDAKKSTVNNRPVELSGQEADSEKSVKKELTLVEEDQEVVPEGKKAIYLTFDDGPNHVTPGILDELKKYDYKATFFMLEPQMRQHPDLVERIIDEGHAVGLHGVTHVVDTFYGSEEAALKEMLDTQDTLSRITGVKSTLVRTPYGSIPYFTDSFRETFEEHELQLWDWNVDSEDWKGGDYLKNVTSQIEKVESNGQTPTIVMHDKEGTVNQLSDLLDYLSTNDFNPVKIHEESQPINFKCNDRCYRRN